MISRTHGMKSIDCYDKDFKAFPKCIPSDAEVSKRYGIIGLLSYTYTNSFEENLF